MKQIEIMLRGVMVAGLLALAPAGHAQLDCGAGAAPGAETQCNTDGLTPAQVGAGAINLHAPDGGTTTFTSTVGQAVGLSEMFESVARNWVNGTGGGAIDLRVRGHLVRLLDFSAHDGGLTLRVEGSAADPQAPGGLILGNSVLGGGDDRLILEAGAVLSFDTFRNQNESLQLRQIDFGDGDDRIINNGYFAVGHSRVNSPAGFGEGGAGIAYAREVSLLNLESFENQGVLALGGLIVTSAFRPAVEFPDSRRLGMTDIMPSTSLLMPGTHFIGGPGSSIHLDAVFGHGRAQVGCADRSLRGVQDNAPQVIPVLPAADCVDLSGGKTSGMTELVIYDEQPGNLAANFGDGEIVLIDVSGGESASEHFVLSPHSQHYDADTGALQQGFFMFPLVYDADSQQHKLVSLPGERALALPHLVQGLQAVARSVGGDAMAAPLAQDVDSGTWVRLSNRQQSRDMRQSFNVYGTAIGVDSSHDIDSTALTVGRSWRTGDWAVGGAISYVDAGVDFDRNRMQADLGGASIGLQAAYRGEALFFDNLAQLTWLEMDVGDPGLLPSRRGGRTGYAELSQSAAYGEQIADVSTQTIQLRSELGWHMAVADGLSIEPLVGASWVRSELDEVTIQSYDPEFASNRFFGDTYDSLRATLGARAAFDQSGERFNLRYTGSLRYWHSLKDETKVTIANAGPDLTVVDDFDGGWTEVTAGISVSNRSGLISGELQAHGMLGDYEGFGITAGLQLRW